MHAMQTIQLDSLDKNTLTCKALRKKKACITYAGTTAPTIQSDHGPLRKHAYSNILKILPPKYENWQIKNSDIFHISAKNKDCGYPLEPPPP